MSNVPTLAQIAAKYGADPDDTVCTGLPSGPRTTSAEKLAAQVKKAKDGRAADKR